jgi:D-alanyl-D-alanine dipeptidase
MLPKGFVYVKDIIPNIVEHMMYCSDDNFLGRKVVGYARPVAILTEQAAQALARVELDLNKCGLGLKIYDAYRPHRAVMDFIAWAGDDDFSMQQKYYPTFENKEDIFNAGFIARYSAHSRGSTVDLTVIEKATNQELDMGGIVDFFGDISHTNYPNISSQARQNRLLLCKIMQKQGFNNYRKEWWHFQLEKEPYTRVPEDHFDFVVA